MHEFFFVLMFSCATFTCELEETTNKQTKKKKERKKKRKKFSLKEEKKNLNNKIKKLKIK